MANVKVWVLTTCLPGDSAPCLPEVFGSENEATQAFDRAMREEWEAHRPSNDDGESLPYPGNPADAHSHLYQLLGSSKLGAWGQWEMTAHTVAID